MMRERTCCALSKEKDKFLEFFNCVYNKYNYSAGRIYTEINKYCDIPKTTFDNTIDSQRENLNTLVVLAFCKTFDFDIDEIYRKESFAGPSLSIQNDMAAVNPELPDGFQGRFYGYFFNSTPDYVQQGKLDQFILDIDSGKIMMTLRHYALDNAKIYKPREIEMQGKIIHNGGGKSPSGILAIAFNSEDNTKFCTLAYNKIQLHGQLYFRKGAMLIYGRGGDDPMPVMQSFIFTHEKIDLGNDYNRNILCGALALTNGTVWLEKNDLVAFRESEALREYFCKMSYEYAVREYVLLDEGAMRRLDVGDKDELYKVLLQMKATAVNPRLFRFPNSGEDRSWRCVTALCEEETLWQEEGTSQEQ